MQTTNPRTQSAPCCLGMQPNCGLWEGPGVYSETTVAYSVLMVIHHFITPRSLCSKLQVSKMDVLAVTFSPSVWAFLHHLQLWCCQGQNAIDFSLIFRWLEILFGISSQISSPVLSSVNCWPLSKSTLFQISFECHPWFVQSSSKLSVQLWSAALLIKSSYAFLQIL